MLQLVLLALFPSLFVSSNLILISMYFFSLEDDELEISPYDNTLMDTRMASLVAGKPHNDINTHTLSIIQSMSCCCCYQLLNSLSITVTHELTS